MRNRGSAVLIEDNRVALIKRVREGSTYYVFPGGGIEKGETPEKATIREAYEELGVRIKIEKCLETICYNGMQYYFQAEIIQGEFGTGKGEEFTDPDRNRGTYKPMWVEVKELSKIDVRPKEIAEKIMSLFK